MIQIDEPDPTFVEDDQSPEPSQMNLNITVMTPKNREIGEQKHQRERSLTPNNRMHLNKSSNYNSLSKEQPSAKKLQDMSFEIKRLEDDNNSLQETLLQKENQIKQLESEVENLKHALMGTTNQLMQNDPVDKRIKDLKTQLQNKDTIIEQLSNQIGLLSSMGSDNAKRTRKKVNENNSGEKQQVYTKKNQLKNDFINISDLNSSEALSASLSPGLSRLNIQNSRFKQNSASFQVHSSTDIPISKNASEKLQMDDQNRNKTGREQKKDSKKGKRSMALF